MSDNNTDILLDNAHIKRVETFKSGVFTFAIGLDLQNIQPLMDRVRDAQDRFSSVPTLPDIATRLEKEVLVSSIYGTNTIEGGTLSEDETAKLISGEEEVKEEKQRRVTNIRSAYEKAEEFAKIIYNANVPNAAVRLQEIMFTDLHQIITDGLSDDPNNIPGHYRDNKPGEITRVSNQEHGGEYVPPKCRDDIVMLIRAFLEWINSEEICRLSPLIRAPLVHYYFERIHPFWDGNGRVGRVLEALVLKSSGFKYAPFALSRYYLENIDEYFTVFNVARKSEEKKHPYPNTPFVEFFLKGLLMVINRLHDRINSFVALLLYETELMHLLNTKKINLRQYTIINNLIPAGIKHDMEEIRSKTWFKGLYLNRTERTQYRDIKKLADLKLIEIAPNKEIKLKITGL